MVTSAKHIVTYLLLHGAVSDWSWRGGNSMIKVQPDPSLCEQCDLCLNHDLMSCLFHRKFVNCMMWDGKKSLSQRILKEVCYEGHCTVDIRLLVMCI